MSTDNQKTKYVVKVDSVFSSLIHVEATSEDEARNLADQIMADDNTRAELQAFYSGTFPKEGWNVITEEEYIALRENIAKELQVSQNVTAEGQNVTPDSEPSNIIVPDRFK